ncbi:hypothetical protein [Kluyvera genomosp. 2]|uniref:hypothetical protein n=1 Tax=Kluyvera genomosp. 2 TaxID=2774054 RepID=UPI002FD80ECB
MGQNPAIADELAFLIEIKNLALTLSRKKDDAVIDAIKQCVLLYQHFIPEGKPAIDFIEQLIITAEKEATDSEIISFSEYLSTFWQWMVQRRPWDFVYVGTRQNVALIEGILDKESLRCARVIYTDEGAAEDLLAVSPLSRPVLLVDNQGERHVGSENGLGLINIEAAAACAGHLDGFLGVIRQHIDMVGILNNNLQKLNSHPQFNKAILGSSFAYYGMHDALLNNSVNLSIASGDATYNKTLVEHCITACNVRDFVIVTGFFELFHELSKGANSYFHLASCFFNENSIPYDYRRQSAYKRFAFHYAREPIVDLLNIDIVAWAAKREIAGLRPHVSLKPEKKITTTSHYSQALARREADYFAQFYDREGVAEYNKLIIQQMVEQVSVAQGHIYFVIQPFTPQYNALFHKEMRQQTKAFLSAIADNESVFFIDMSEDRDFEPEDYSDAHHLNFRGARKLLRKLEWLQL